ncbi:MAG: hypothetical protein MRY32_09740 [Rickettsiales bacterium]|nr:hypothetical protein [Rickettsiales bacterium]
MVRVFLSFGVFFVCAFAMSAQATPLYPGRVAPVHTMTDGSVNHVFLKRLPVPKPRDAVSVSPPPPLLPATAAKTTILNPEPLQPAAKPVAVNPYENAPFQVKPRSDYKKLRAKR